MLRNGILLIIVLQKNKKQKYYFLKQPDPNEPKKLLKFTYLLARLNCSKNQKFMS